MPFQLDKKKLLIGGGLLLLLIIVIIVAVAMKNKSAEEHAADARDAANAAVMHANIANAAAKSPDNSAKDSTVKTAIEASIQAGIQSKDSGSKAAAGGVSVTTPTDSVTIPAGPTASSASGKYYLYFIRDGTYLNTTNLKMVSDKADASVVYRDSNSAILSNADQSTLLIEGVQVQASLGSKPAVANVPGGTGFRVALNEYGQAGNLFPVFQNTGVLGAGQNYTVDQALNDPNYAFALVQA